MRAVALAFALGACDPLGGLRVEGDDPTDAPIEGLDSAALDRFARGDALFEAPLRESQGLGPLYIRHACVSCHLDDARGPGVVEKMIVLEGGQIAPDQSALRYGPTVRPQLAAGATIGVVPPVELELWISLRLGPAVFGRGFLEAIDGAEIERLEREQASGEDGVSGRIHRVNGEIGRFGLKARLASIDELVADAYQGDMGITSPLRPQELPNPEAIEDDALAGVDVDGETLALVADYVRMLAIPRREPIDGADLFERARCARCHVPSLSVRADHPIAPFARDAPVYSDLLLHDMGAALDGGVPENDASAREWRTAPLIGMRHSSAYLHDGRARSIEEAILAHESEGSEANVSVARFRALDPTDRDRLIAFVESL